MQGSLKHGRMESEVHVADLGVVILFLLGLELVVFGKAPWDAASLSFPVP